MDRLLKVGGWLKWGVWWRVLLGETWKTCPNFQEKRPTDILMGISHIPAFLLLHLD